MNTRWFAAPLLACLALTGCQSTLPAGPAGVLSVIQQKTLDLAAKKAIAKAHVSPEQVRTKGLRVRAAEADGSDVGKNFVAGVVKDHLQGMDSGEPPAGLRDLDYQVVLAGVDISAGGFLFVKSVTTQAEVQLRFRDAAANPAITEGTGTAKHKQTWLFGLGPSVKLN